MKQIFHQNTPDNTLSHQVSKTALRRWTAITQTHINKHQQPHIVNYTSALQSNFSLLSINFRLPAKAFLAGFDFATFP